MHGEEYEIICLHFTFCSFLAFVCFFILCVLGGVDTYDEVFLIDHLQLSRFSRANDA